MLKASYRNEQNLTGLDIHFEEKYLPVIIESIIHSLNCANVEFLRISQSPITENEN